MSNLLSWWPSLVIVGIATSLYIWHRHKTLKSLKNLAKRKLKYIDDLPDPASVIWTKIEKIESLKTKIIQREGPLFAFSMMGSTTIMVADAGLVQAITTRQFTNFVNRRIFPAFDNILNQSVFMAIDSQWKRLRQVLTPAFSVGKLKQLKPKMDSTVATMIKNFETKIKENPVQNVKPLFDAFTIDFLVTNAFGVVIDSLNDPNHPIIVHGQKLITYQMSLTDYLKMALISITPRFAKMINLHVMGEYTGFFSKLSKDIIAQKRVEYSKTKNFTKASSFIEFMLEAEKQVQDEEQSSKYITTDEMVAQCVIFLLAGFDTTSGSLTMCAYFLAKHTDVQERLFTETVTVIEKLKQETENKGKEENIFNLISFEAIMSKFPFLNAVISESLRLHPPAIFTERTTSEDVHLESDNDSNEKLSLDLKAGEIVHIPIWTLHRDKAYWGEDADDFNPQRFIENSGVNLKNIAFMPFGAGGRMCIAQRLASIELRLALLHLLRHFRFAVCTEKTETEVEFVNQFDVNSPKAVHLKIVKR